MTWELSPRCCSLTAKLCTDSAPTQTRRPSLLASLRCFTKEISAPPSKRTATGFDSFATACPCERSKPLQAPLETRCALPGFPGKATLLSSGLLWLISYCAKPALNLYRTYSLSSHRIWLPKKSDAVRTESCRCAGRFFSCRFAKRRSPTEALKTCQSAWLPFSANQRAKSQSASKVLIRFGRN